MKFLITLILILTLGCGEDNQNILGIGSGQLHTDVCHLTIDYHFNIEEINTIKNATYEWENVTNGMVIFNASLGKPLDEPHHVLEKDYFIGYPESNEQIHLYTRAIYDIDRDAYFKNLKIIAMHELGHHLGIPADGHLSGDHIMNAKPLNSSGKITAEDIQLLCNVGYLCEKYFP